MDEESLERSSVPGIARRDPVRERFLWVYEKYSRRVFAFALRLAREKSLAEDLLSETMLKAMSALAGGRELDGDIFPWLCTICANLYRDQKRKDRVRWLYYEEQLRERQGMAVKQGDLPLSKRETHACWQEIRVHIESMEENRRTCILLKLSGNSYQEISELTNTEPDQVRSHIQNAMRELRKKFGSASEEERPE